jgi:HAD superfamily hydrolase (TIGR01509 family)
MNRARNFRAAVFDLDGTLVDSLPLVLQSIAHAISPFASQPTMDIFSKLGGPPARFIPELVGDPRHVAEAIARMAIFHHDNAHLIESFDGVRGLLERLHAQGVRTAIWTGRDRASAEQLLATHRLAELFSVVLCGDDLPSHKPDPEGLRVIMARLGVVAAETIFVGDADVDVLGGAACGVDTVLIRHARAVADVISAKAWRIVDRPREAYDLVLSCVE